MARLEILNMEEVEQSRGWCDACLHETMLTVTYFVNSSTQGSFLDTITWCEDCQAVEVDWRDDD